MDIYSIPGIELDANEIQRRINEFNIQSSLIDRYPSASRACEALDKGSWTKRKEAMIALIFHGAKEDVLRYALAEKEAEVIVDIACKYLAPVPPVLMSHYIDMKRQSFRMRLHYTISRTNCLHLEEDILSRMYKKKDKPHPTDLESLGAAYFRSASPLLEKFTKISQLRSYFDAIQCGRNRSDKPESTIMLSAIDPKCIFDAPSQRAIAALVALRRIDAPIDISLVRDLRDHTSRVDGHVGKKAWRALTWVMFDAGHDIAEEELEHQEYLDSDVQLDLANTYLKKKDFQRFDALIENRFRRPDPAYFCHWPISDVYLLSNNFCHWPVADAIIYRRFQRHGIDYVWDDGSTDGYCHGRDMGLAPPPWWTWQSEWTLSRAGRAFLGLLKRPDGAATP